MKVFDNLEKEQSGMYRWMRKHLTKSMFERLTGLDYEGKLTEMEIDLALKRAYEEQQRHDAPFDVQHRSKIRSGVFPAALGLALEEFVVARIDASHFEEGLGGMTHGDYDRLLKAKFLALAEEMAKLR